MDYPYRLVGCRPGDTLLLLPSPWATLLSVRGSALLLGPHRGVRRVRGAQVLMSCSPNVVKAFAGHPWLFVDRAASVRQVPLLRVFQEEDPQRWPVLLADLRSAVEVTADERRFAVLWRALVARTQGEPPRPEPQRQAERLCRRYAGQPPSAVRRALRLSDQLAADLAAGRHRSLGELTDQSHYVRECRALTGATPGRWLRAEGTWHAPDGAPVLRATAPDHAEVGVAG